MKIKKLTKFLIACIVICAILLMGAGLGKVKSVWHNFNKRIDTIADNSSMVISGSINGQRLELDLKDGNRTIQLDSLNTEYALPVNFKFNNHIKMYLDGAELTNGQTYEYTLSAINENHYVNLRIENLYSGQNWDYSIKTLPDFVPHFTVTGSGSPIKGDYYINGYYDPNAILKIGNDGAIKFYKYAGGHELIDFKKVVTESGKVRYIYAERFDSKYSIPGAAYCPVQYVVLDDHYKELQRISMKKSVLIPSDGFPADSHDLLYIDDNHYFVMGYRGKSVNNIPKAVWSSPPDMYSNVVDCVIQEILDGKVVFEWDCAKYPELYALSQEGNDFANAQSAYADYAHLNSMTLDPADGKLVCSFRNLDSIIKIDQATGELKWILGGKGDSFGLDGQQKSSRQHYARFNTNGSLSIFDNGNAKGQSRVVEYWLDEVNRRVTEWKEYKVKNYFSYATGSAQRLSNNEDIFLIGWGMNDNPLQPSASEINFSTGEVFFELRFANCQIYRCVKY